MAEMRLAVDVINGGGDVPNCDKSRTVRLGGASVLASRRLKKTRLVSSLAPPDELFTCRKAILRYNAGRLWRKTSRPTKTA
jgi:hypothetical protein